MAVSFVEMNSEPKIADSLLMHAAFVRRLARGLAGASGEDLAQDTWIAALQAPAVELQSVRAWLATIAANAWRSTKRAAVRRTRREAALTATAVAPSVAEIVEREEVRRRVVAAVVELPQLLREVVLLRFFEGLDSPAIGARLGLPASTVRTRVQQALLTLRRRLDADHGDQRSAWALPLAGFAWSEPISLVAVMLRVAWPFRVMLGVAALVVLSCLVLPWWLGPPNLPLMPTPGPVEVASVPRRDELATPVPASQRQAAASEVPVAGVRGPEDLWGRVVAAADGAPINGAEVVLQHCDADEMTSLDLEHNKHVEVIGAVRSDVEGRFQFRVARALQHRLVVRAGGFAVAHEAKCTGGSEFVVRLDRASFVEGVVRRQDGAPLGDVAIAAFERRSMAMDARLTTQTAADGSFFLAGLGSKPTYVMAQPAGLLAPGWQLVELLPGQGGRLEFIVGVGRIVRGIVRDAETKAPVVGARIGTSWAMDDSVITAADGSYELRGCGRESGLYVRAEGYADDAMTVIAKDDVVTIDLELWRGFEVTGRIVDPAGRTIPGTYVAAAADVTLRTMNQHTFWRTATVAPDGRFTLRGLGRTSVHGRSYFLQWQLLLRAPGYGTRVLALPVPKSSRGDCDIGLVVMQPQGLLEGRVVDGDGQPVARAEVDLRALTNGIGDLLPAGESAPEPLYHFATRQTFTTQDGTFRFAGLGVGSYRLAAQLQDKSWQIESGPHQVVDGAIVTVPDLIAEPGLVIEGTLRLAGGREVPAGSPCTIYAHGPQSEQRYAKVSADGRFRIERLEPGTYLLSALDVPKGFALLPRRLVPAGTKDLELTLAVAETIEGRVVGPDNKPVRDMTVCFWPEGVVFAHYERTDVEGRFRLEVAPGAVGRVSAQDPQDMFRQAQQPDVVAGVHDLVLKLPR